MKVSELMGKYVPNPDYEGPITNDDFVTAIDISESQDAPISEYVVAQACISGVDSNLNPETQTKQYLRQGKSTTKTGTQRTLSISGDLYVGDEFQDFVMSAKVKYGTGNDVIVNYARFNLKNGKGEKGRASVIVNSDGGGTSGESASIDVSLEKFGEMPEEFTYSEAIGTSTYSFDRS